MFYDVLSWKDDVYQASDRDKKNKNELQIYSSAKQ